MREAARQSPAPFVPALGVGWLTGAYDMLSERFFPEMEVKRRLLDNADVQTGMRVLDLGCGTGTLAAMAARRGAAVIGVDADPAMLQRAEPKIAGLTVALIRALTTELTLEQVGGAGSGDVVLSSLMFHHLSMGAKLQTLQLARTWLRPGGEIHIADWSKPRTIGARLRFGVVQLLDGIDLTREVLSDAVPEAMTVAGFCDVQRLDTIPTILGDLSWWRGAAP